MIHILSRRAVGFAVLLSAVAVLGCGKKEVPLVPVQGKVTVDNQPVTSGQVALIPSAEAEKGAGLSAGQIDSSGQYKIFTNGKEGAPVGKYKVTISPSMVPAEGMKKMPTTPYNASYKNSRETKLEIEVVDNAPPGKYDLKLSK